LFHAHPILKMKNGYSESWSQCQMKLERSKTFALNFIAFFGNLENTSIPSFSVRQSMTINHRKGFENGKQD
jgi:hypothetical protein